MSYLFTKRISTTKKRRRNREKSLATKLAILFQPRSKQTRKLMKRTKSHEMSLHSSRGERKYLNGAERSRFASAIGDLPNRDRLFALTLAYAGGRISEVLGLAPEAFDPEEGFVAIKTLKRRQQIVVRQVPLPPWLVSELDREFDIRSSQRDPYRRTRRLWAWSRVTGWRRIKNIMAVADIHGMAACPKALRHTFGVTSFQAKLPPHLVQRWLGHASIRTTAIYGDVIGPEEREFAERIWSSW